jgi:hypothetical protein
MALQRAAEQLEQVFVIVDQEHAVTDIVAVGCGHDVSSCRCRAKSARERAGAIEASPIARRSPSSCISSSEEQAALLGGEPAAP